MQHQPAYTFLNKANRWTIESLFVWCNTEWLCKLGPSLHLDFNGLVSFLPLPEHRSERYLYILSQTRLRSVYQLMIALGNTTVEACRQFVELYHRFVSNAEAHWSTNCLAQEGKPPSSVAALSCWAGFHVKMPKGHTHEDFDTHLSHFFTEQASLNPNTFSLFPFLLVSTVGVPIVRSRRQQLHFSSTSFLQTWSEAWEI